MTTTKLIVTGQGGKVNTPTESPADDDGYYYEEQPDPSIPDTVAISGDLIPSPGYLVPLLEPESAGDRILIPTRGADTSKYLKLMNEKHAVTKENGKTVVVEFVGAQGIEYSTTRELEQFYRHIKIQMGDGAVKSLGQWWLDNPDRRQYEAIVFEPLRPGTKPKGSSRYTYNRWRETPLKPAPGNWSLYADNLLHNMCRGNQEHYEYLMNWMAHAVQKPDEKPGVAVVLRSDERGTGKSTACRYFASLFGQHALEVSSADHLTGRFNGHLETLIVLVVNEAIWAGDHAAESVLKTLITEPYMTVENKHRAVLQRPSYLRVMMTANSSWVVPAGWSERRFFVLEASDRAVSSPEYWTELTRQMKEGGTAGLMYDLLRRDIGRFNPRNVPVTQALVDQKLQSMDDSTRWLFDCLARGTWSKDHQEWKREIGRNELYDLYVEQAAKGGGRKPRAMQTELGKLIARVFPGSNKGPYVRVFHERTRHYIFPDLEQSRAEFSRYLQAPITLDLFAHSEPEPEGVTMIVGPPNRDPDPFM